MSIWWTSRRFARLLWTCQAGRKSKRQAGAGTPKRQPRPSRTVGTAEPNRLTCRAVASEPTAPCTGGLATSSGRGTGAARRRGSRRRSVGVGKARDPAATTAPATCFSPASRIQRAAERPLVAVACAANDLEGGEISRELRGRLTCALITIGCMSRRRTTISFAQRDSFASSSIDVVIGSDHLDR